MRWPLVVVLCACGARTDLSSLPADAADTNDDDGGAVDGVPAPEGPCTSVEYATSHFTTARFSVDATSVYYMLDSSTVARVAKSGGKPSIVHSFTDAEWLFESFVLDGTSLFWCGGGKNQVFTMPESGGPSNALGAGGPTLGVNDDVIVFQLSPAMSQLAMLPKGGGDATLLSPEVAPTAPALEAFVDGKRVYWMTGEHVFALDLAAHGALTTVGAWPTGIAGDDDTVYWATLGDVVRYAKKDGASAGALEGHARGPIAVGKDAVFGVSQEGIVKVPKAGGPAALVVSTPDAGGAPNQIMTAGNCVYYSTTKGTLARFPQ